MATRRSLSADAARAMALLDRMERVHSAAIRRAFLTLVTQYGAQWSDEVVLRYLTTGVIPSIDEEFREVIEDVLRPAWEQVIDAGARLQDPLAVSRGLLASGTLDRHAIQWIDHRGSMLVTNFSQQQRLALNAVLEGSQRWGWSVPDTADAIRGVVGLTRRQAESLVKLEAELREQGATPRVMMRTLNRRRRQMEMQRAESIARTELNAAINEGKIAAALAEDEDVNDGLTPRMFVVAHPDCCPNCEEIEDTQPDDGISLYDEWDMWGRPPFHPNCRCVVVIRRMKI